jgi:hypothetical protein
VHRDKFDLPTPLRMGIHFVEQTQQQTSERRTQTKCKYILISENWLHFCGGFVGSVIKRASLSRLPHTAMKQCTLAEDKQFNALGHDV